MPGRPAAHVDQARTVGHQPAGVDEFPLTVHRRKRAAAGELGDFPARAEVHRIGQHEQGRGALLHHDGECIVNLIRRLRPYVLQLDAELARRGLEFRRKCGMRSVERIHQGRNARGGGSDLPQQLELLARDLGSGEQGHARDVPARMRKAGDESLAKRVRAREHDDRFRRSRRLARAGRCR